MDKSKWKKASQTVEGNTIKKFCCYILAIAIGCSFTHRVDSASAQEPLYYKGKTVRFIVAYSAGGSFDTITRAIARHIGKHIPGNPKTTVENMTGAGGIIAANYLFNKTKPDGLTIGNWIGSLVFQQIFGKKSIEFDARRFEWVGVPAVDHPVCALTEASGVTKLDKWLSSKKSIKIGGIGPGGTASDVPRILKAALGLPIKVIDGYKGPAKIGLAAKAGEIAGGCWGWRSIKVTWRKGIESGKVHPVLQVNPKRHPDLQKVPNAIELAKTDQARQLIKVGIHDQAALTRLYSLPPGTPKERVKILQKAFVDTMSDPEFLAETKNFNLEIKPKSGEEVKEIVDGFFKMDTAVLSRLKEIIVYKR
ncbi:MAG: Bug family tripartite tricarboxylate transporter substrate binding protein [Candidatus Binatia bacterium]